MCTTGREYRDRARMEVVLKYIAWWDYWKMQKVRLDGKVIDINTIIHVYLIMKN